MTSTTDSLAAIAWGDCLVPRAQPSPQVVARIRAERGFVPDWVPRLASLPWVAYAMNAFPSAPFAYLPMRLWDLVALVVSRDNSCRFCWGAQRNLMRLLGYDAREIDGLERDHLMELGAGERQALEFARRLSRGTPRPGAADLATLEAAGLGPAVIRELTFAAVAAVFTNRVSTLLALPPVHLPAPLLLAARLARPLVVRRFARRRRRAPEPSPHPNDGVGATVVAALGDSPAAGVLRRALNGARDSPVLPPHTKLLVVAVIARALDAVPIERDATAALIAAGMSQAEVRATLEHLVAPSVDARDTALLTFARETVRCTPATIQEQLRGLAATFDLDVEQRLELVGVAALANALCRASVLVPPC